LSASEVDVDAVEVVGNLVVVVTATIVVLDVIAWFEVVVVLVVVVGVFVVGVVVEVLVSVSGELESTTLKPIAIPIIIKVIRVNETKNMILNFLVSLDFLTSLSSSDSISNVSWGLILLVLIFLPYNLGWFFQFYFFVFVENLFY
jgi:hypothetical protein